MKTLYRRVMERDGTSLSAKSASTATDSVKISGDVQRKFGWFADKYAAKCTVAPRKEDETSLRKQSTAAEYLGNKSTSLGDIISKVGVAAEGIMPVLRGKILGGKTFITVKVKEFAEVPLSAIDTE